MTASDAATCSWIGACSPVCGPADGTDVGVLCAHPGGVDITHPSIPLINKTPNVVITPPATAGNCRSRLRANLLSGNPEDVEMGLQPNYTCHVKSRHLQDQVRGSRHVTLQPHPQGNC